jgi:hypothetical protein
MPPWAPKTRRALSWRSSRASEGTSTRMALLLLLDSSHDTYRVLGEKRRRGREGRGQGLMEGGVNKSGLDGAGGLCLGERGHGTCVRTLLMKPSRSPFSTCKERHNKTIQEAGFAY